DYAIPQRTILGPLLYNIYVSSLALNSNGKIFSYADDTVICYDSDNWDNVHNIAEQDLNKLKLWFDYMSLKMNTKKSCYMTFSSKNKGQPNTSKITIHDCTQPNNCQCTPLNKEENVKYLGLIINQNLKWETHLEHLIKKLRYMMHIFHHLKNILSFNTLRVVYFALIQSQLQYGISVWGGTFKTSLIRLQRTQNILKKIILKRDRMAHSKDLYKDFNVFNINRLYTLKLANFAIKYKDKWTQNITHYNLRNPRAVIAPTVKKTTSQKHFNYLGPIIYNKIPEDIRNIMVPTRRTLNLKKWITELSDSDLENLIQP
ncbi:hypothetical protein WDU94_008898, partial [Cyamophila willieti]